MTMTVNYQPNMEIIRMPKDKEHSFTVISNDESSFAQDERLSPNAYGILCKALSLLEKSDDSEDGWHFSVSGFCKIMNAGETRNRSELKELEQLGYFVMVRTRDELGRFRKAVYRFSESVQEAWRQSRNQDVKSESNSDSENDLNPTFYPCCDFPHVDNPNLENQAQSNTNIYNTNSDLSQSVSPACTSNSTVEN